MNKKIVGVLVSRITTPTFLTVLFTLALSAAVNLLTGLVGNQSATTWQAGFIILASAFWVCAGFLLCAAESRAQLVRNSAVDYEHIESQLTADPHVNWLGNRLWGAVLTTGIGAVCLVFSYSPLEASQGTTHAPNTEPPKRMEACAIGYQEIALYRHVFVAQAKGFFNEEGLEVKLTSLASGNNIMQALIANSIDVAGLTNLEVALSVESKDPGRFAMVNMLVWGERSFPDYILARTDSGINALKELEGRTIGVHPGSATGAFSRTVLQKEGVDISKCTFLEVTPATMQAAIVAKRIDALYCMDPVATSLLQSKQCVVLLANPLAKLSPLPIPISGTALSRKFMQERPEAARRVTRALEKAILYLRAPGHEKEVAEIISKYTPISTELATKMNASEYWTTLEVDPKLVQLLADRFWELKIVDRHVDVKNFIASPGFLTHRDASDR